MPDFVIFFDGECPLCNRAVRFLASRDKKEKFAYAPLQGETAKKTFGQPPALDTLVLVEGNRPLYYGKGALRICWYLGGAWRLLGALSFLPTLLADGIYRLIAKNRHLFGKTVPELKDLGTRLLP